MLGMAMAAWLAVAFLYTPPVVPVDPNAPAPSPRRTWEERKDSMRHADSVRYAQWAAEREQRYDSFRLADSLRRAGWKRERQQQYDSFRIADSLWRDSVWKRFPRHVKKDTMLDLNHCDTSELVFLRGIGPYTARRIIAYREELGGYYSPSQLTDEPLESLHLDTLLYRFTADTSVLRTIDVNSSTATALSQHPYLRYEQAKAIYTLRRKRVYLLSAEELRALPELSAQDIERLRPYLRFEH